ncbi:MAG: glucokinase [Steroidobacteraceae bacterium]
MTIAALPNIVADIGGTNARFAICESGTYEIHDEQQLRCGDFSNIDSAIRIYLELVGERRPLGEAAIAIAAPVMGDEIALTNNHWRFSATAMRKSLGLKRLIVVNDFTALAMAIGHLPSRDLVQVGGEAQTSTAPIALVGAGTGLGVSGLIHAGDQWIPLQGEGGHVSIAPGDAREAAVLMTLWRRFKHVSAERVLSGTGLVNLYTALCELDDVPILPYRAEHVTEHGVSGSCAQCKEALSMFCGLLGSVAGNLVLTLGATQAVYVGGGIVPRLGQYFLESPFRSRFEDKGRYVDYLKPVPAYVIHSPYPAFIGLSRSFVTPGPRFEVSE